MPFWALGMCYGENRDWNSVVDALAKSLEYATFMTMPLVTRFSAICQLITITQGIGSPEQVNEAVKKLVDYARVLGADERTFWLCWYDRIAKLDQSGTVAGTKKYLIELDPSGLLAQTLSK
jgi:hypothetical protein